jgi:hypothetical protein
MTSILYQGRGAQWSTVMAASLIAQPHCLLPSQGLKTLQRDDFVKILVYDVERRFCFISLNSPLLWLIGLGSRFLGLALR